MPKYNYRRAQIKPLPLDLFCPVTKSWYISRGGGGDSIYIKGRDGRREF